MILSSLAPTAEFRPHLQLQRVFGDCSHNVQNSLYRELLARASWAADELQPDPDVHALGLHGGADEILALPHAEARALGLQELVLSRVYSHALFVAQAQHQGVAARIAFRRIPSAALVGESACVLLPVQAAEPGKSCSSVPRR